MALDEIDMTNKEATTFCVSWDTCNVTKYGLIEVAASQNCQQIPNMYFYHFFYLFHNNVEGKTEEKDRNKTGIENPKIILSQWT